MNKLEQLAAKLSPTLRKLAGQWGATVTVYQRAESFDDVNAAVQTYTADPALTNLQAFIGNPETARKQKLFGVTETTQLVLRIPRQAGGLVTITIGAGFRITSGPYKDQTFVAQNSGVPDVAGLSVMVPLVSAPDGAIS